METERQLPVKSLNELLWLFMRQAAVEGAARKQPVRRPIPAVRSARRLKEGRTS